MSKHNKPYHNYNNYSNNTAKPAEPVVEPITATEEVGKVETTVETTPVTEEVEQVEVTEPATTEPVEEPATEPTPTIGVVNCSLLRVRSAADSSIVANVICEIPEGTEVQIDNTKSTEDFYAITTTVGVEGFCMKKFITIK